MTLHNFLLCYFFSILLFSDPMDPTAESGDAGKEPQKKTKTTRKREAASKKLLAAGHKIKYAFVSG